MEALNIDCLVHVADLLNMWLAKQRNIMISRNPKKAFDAKSYNTWVPQQGVLDAGLAISLRVDDPINWAQIDKI